MKADILNLDEKKHGIWLAGNLTKDFERIQKELPAEANPILTDCAKLLSGAERFDLI